MVSLLAIQRNYAYLWKHRQCHSSHRRTLAGLNLGHIHRCRNGAVADCFFSLSDYLQTEILRLSVVGS